MECSKEGHKFEAMKKKKKREKFVYNLVLYTLTSLITCFFFTYPLLLQSMTTMTQLLLPVVDVFNDVFVLDAKCCFIIANLIVLVLVWEPLVKGSSCSPPSFDIYDEYVARSRGNRILKANYSKETGGIVPTPITQEKNRGGVKTCLEERNKKKKKTKREVVTRTCESIPDHREERKIGMRSCKSESDIAKKEQVKATEEEEAKDYNMAMEEFNMRVETFIARVNKQKLVEAQIMENDRG